MFGARRERGHRGLIASVATQVETVRIGMAASETSEVGIQGFLNAQCLRFSVQRSSSITATFRLNGLATSDPTPPWVTGEWPSGRWDAKTAPDRREWDTQVRDRLLIA